MRRLVASLINEGLITATHRKGRLRMRTDNGELAVRYKAREGVDQPCFPHPGDLVGPVSLDGRPLSDVCAVLDTVHLPATPSRLSALRDELTNSVEQMLMSENYRGTTPDIDGPAWDWECAVIEGHARHPGHRTRLGLTIKQSRKWTAEARGNVTVRFAVLPAGRIQRHGPYDALIATLTHPPPDGFVLVPVHTAQSRMIEHVFGDIEYAEHEINARPQTSLRTLSPMAWTHHLKLPLAVRTTSAVRTISPNSVYNATRISRVVSDLAPPELVVLGEVASAGIRAPDPDDARHFAAIIRQNPEHLHPKSRFVLGAALQEIDERGAPHVQNVAEQTGLGNLAFFDRYATLLLDATLPLLRAGVALEAHGQNVLARFDNVDGEWTHVGFAVRDFGGVRIHRGTLRAHGHDLDLYPDSAPDASNMTAVWTKWHHCVVQSHLREILRGLNLGVAGWTLLRERIDARIDGQAHEFITAETVPYKCLLRMRIEDRYKDYVEREVPNPLVTHVR